ncbi:MAG: hypothetical protein ACOX6T_21425, partial [Myxococcales bacterium]
MRSRHRALSIAAALAASTLCACPSVHTIGSEPADACVPCEGCDLGCLPPPCDGGDCGCVPETDAELCAELSLECGPAFAEDRCGERRAIHCGGCEALLSCGGAGKPNRCGCLPESDWALCLQLEVQCGEVQAIDSCGHGRTLDCGGCPWPQTCGGAGQPGIC